MEQVYTSNDEQRYRKLLSGVELTKNFYFSYSWPLWRTVQAGLSEVEPDDPWTSMFVWNSYLTRSLGSMAFLYLSGLSISACTSAPWFVLDF